MTHIVTLIPGDGIGPEVTEAVVGIVGAAGVSIDWDRHDAGVLAFERTGQPLPTALVDSIRRNRVALKGPVTTPIGEGFTSVNVSLRKALDLYVNLRPVIRYPGVQTIVPSHNEEDVNLVNGHVLFSDQEALANEAYAASTDHGDTFLTQTPVPNATTATDRQWLAATPHGGPFAAPAVRCKNRSRWASHVC